MAQSYTNKVENASEQVGRAAGLAEQATDAAKDYAAEAADRVTALARDAYENPEQFAREAQTNLTKYTQDNPLQALAIAAGLAFVVGALWKK